MGSATILCYSLVWVCGVFSLGACSWPRVGAQGYQSHYEVNTSNSSFVGSKPSSWAEHGFINWQIRRRKIAEEREVDAFLPAVSYWRVAGNGGEHEKAAGRSCCSRSIYFLGKSSLLLYPFHCRGSSHLVPLCWQGNHGIKLVYNRAELGKSQINRFWQHCAAYIFQLFPVKLRDRNFNVSS